MKCPRCKKRAVKVIDTRQHPGGFSIRRRRKCLGCGYRFNATERVEEAPRPFTIVDLALNSLRLEKKKR